MQLEEAAGGLGNHIQQVGHAGPLSLAHHAALNSRRGQGGQWILLLDLSLTFMKITLGDFRIQIIIVHDFASADIWMRLGLGP